MWPLDPTYDVLVGGHGPIGSFSGATIQARGLAAAFEDTGRRAVLMGFVDRAIARRDGHFDREPVTVLEPSPGALVRLNVALAPLPLLWRAHNWLLPRRLAAILRRLPRPQLAVVSFSPYWIAAAKRAWPDLPAVFRYCGVLSNCAAFARPAAAAVTTLWQRWGERATRDVECEALCRADCILTSAHVHRAEIAALEPSVLPRLQECVEGCDYYNTGEDVRAAQRAALAIADNEFLALAVGTCDRNKAFDHALCELESTDCRVRLVIVGDGPERPALRTMSAELGLDARVHFAPAPQDIAAWYAAADCVVSTSHYDTFPNVIKEAACCGLPVLVPRHDPPHVYAGIAELVERGGLGMTYDRRRPGALASCLNQLVRSDPQPAAARPPRRDKARRLFSWDATLRQVLRVAGVIEPPRPAGADAAGTTSGAARSADGVVAWQKQV